MYSAHHNGESLRTVFSTPEIGLTFGGEQVKLWGLAGSASLHGEDLVLSVVNPSITESREAEIIVHCAEIKSGQAKVLTAEDIHTHNSFNNPNALYPRENSLKEDGEKLVYVFPPSSVVRFLIELS